MNNSNKKKIILVVLKNVGIVLLGILLISIPYSLLIKSEEQIVSKKKVEEKMEVATRKDNAIVYKGKKYRYNNSLSNFLFLGIDTREKVNTSQGKANAGQSDVIFVLSWDRIQHEFTLISIPRDTMTQIEVFDVSGESIGKTTEHISLAYAFGDGNWKSCELAKNAVSNLLYQVPIQGYSALNLDSLPLIVKAVGGVPVTVPDNSLEEVNSEFINGSQVILDENNVETFIRYRDTTKSQSALVRLSRQKVFLDAYKTCAIEQFEKESGFVSDLYVDLKPYMVTNIGVDQLVKIMEDAAKEGEQISLTIPGEGSEGKAFDEYHVDDEKLYEMVIEVFYEEVD